MEKQLNREKTIITTSVIGIIGNIFLVGFKAAIGFIVNSAALISDAINNLTDALSSLITIIGTKLSNKKPNRKHPFGYGRIEYITSTIIAALILFAGGTALFESINSIVEYWSNSEMSSTPTYEIYMLVIIGVAILVKIGIGLLFRYKAKKVDSEALKSSGNDALFDAILSTSTLIGALIATFTNIYVEGYLGILIGGFIIKSGIEALISSLSSILGERFDPEFTNEIKKDIRGIEGVLGAYDLIIHSYGPNKNIGSVHIGVKESLSAKEVQDLERKISYLMNTKYNVITTVGIYAENESSKIGKKIKNKLTEILKDYPHVLQMHGFYVDEEKKYCNFDLVISFDDKEIEKHFEEIKERIQNEFKDYQFFIAYDPDFSLTSLDK
jgi:cation diffusion facilitator family transporter